MECDSTGKMNVKIKGKVNIDSGKITTGARNRDMDSEEGTGKGIGRRRNEIAKK